MQPFGGQAPTYITQPEFSDAGVGNGMGVIGGCGWVSISQEGGGEGLGGEV